MWIVLVTMEVFANGHCQAPVMEWPTGTDRPLAIALGRPNSALLVSEMKAHVGAVFPCPSLAGHLLSQHCLQGTRLAAANSGHGALHLVLAEALGLPTLMSSQRAPGLLSPLRNALATASGPNDP